MSDTTGWLIEREAANGLPLWLCNAEANEWVRDASAAICFETRDDAERFILAHEATIGPSEPFPTEHQWISPEK